MNEVLPGIFHLKVPIPNNPLGHTNVYLVKGEGRALLIDVGSDSAESYEAIEEQLKAAGVGTEQVSSIVITHAHGDHIGLAARVRTVSGAGIAMHRLERPRLRRTPPDPAAFAAQAEKWLHASGMPSEPAEAETHHPLPRFFPPPDADVILEDGDVLQFGALDLRVVWTPGHSPGHICLYEAGQRLLFSGDHVLPVTTPNVGLRPGQTGPRNPLGDYLESLDKVRKLDVGLVLPAHEHAFNNLAARVDEIKAHHRHRSEEVMETLRTGPKSAYEVSGAITWMPQSGGVRFESLRRWHQRMAVSETLAHLEALRGAGAIRRFLKGAIVYYHLTT